MAYSGAFMQGAAVTETPKPNPDNRHGKMSVPDYNWSPPPAEVTPMPFDVDGQAVAAPMTGRGLQLDGGHRWGHRGTGKTAFARAMFTSQGAAQDASAAAHGDRNAAANGVAMYQPYPSPFWGEQYDVDAATGREGVPFGARAVIHDRPGGQFMDGSGGSFQTTGQRLGVSRRWARAAYQSPMLGAMYSRNYLRGVLPQVIQVPVPQPAPGGILYNAGIGSQQRQVFPRFTTPKLFRMPPSFSDQMIADQPDPPEYGPVI